MPEQFEGDLAEAVFWGADLSRARFRDVDLTGVTITHAWVTDVTIDAFVERLVVNGVDVTDFVNQRDPWFPLRQVLRPTDVASMQSGSAQLAAAWAAAAERMRRLPDAAAHESVGGEWSFVQTLRHLIFAFDKWFGVPVLGGEMQPIGQLDAYSQRGDWPAIDPDADPTLREVLAVFAAQMARLEEYLAGIYEDALVETVDVPDAGPHEIRQCIATVLEEGFWHLRYADRDLAQLEASGG